jgi:hypothetical protein
MLTLTRITAKFPGKCAESGKAFQAGTVILHDQVRRRCFLPGSEPEGAVVTEPVAGAKSAAYHAGWAAGAPDAPLTRCPHVAGSPEAKMWGEGLRDRHASGN